MLEFIERINKKTKYNQYYGLYRCSYCGNKKIVMINNANRNTFSCGCQSRKLEKGVSLMKDTYNQYRLNAKRRKIDFNLTLEEFKKIVQQNCAYCGLEPSNIKSHKGSNGNFVYNGIDRIDNSIGYTVENCLPCCHQCNRAKSKMELKEFLLWLKQSKEWLFGSVV